jgi:outer membrane autotransporter protein
VVKHSRSRAWLVSSTLLASILLAASTAAAQVGGCNNNGTWNQAGGTLACTPFLNNVTGRLRFFDGASAGVVILTNLGRVEFHDTSTGGNATSTNSASMSFLDTSTAGNATITTNSGATTLFSNNATAGNARLIANAGGTVDFSGTTGPLGDQKISVGSIEGAGTFFLGANQLTAGSNNLSTTVSGTIQDGGTSGGTGGSLVKSGSGTLVLAGSNTYTGGTTLNAGGLTVNGSLASGVTVNAGTLSGSGSIGGLTLNGGVIAPGNSIGTMTVNGNFVQNAGSVYQVEANSAGQSDKINVSGSATINGGMVQVLAQPGSYNNGTAYTILTAAGGVSGTYSSVTSNFAFLKPLLSYDPTNVYLTLLLGSFAAGAQTPNQYAVGTVLDQTFSSATGDYATVMSALAVLNTAQGPFVLNAISGQNYAGFSNAMVQGAQLFMSNFSQQAGGSTQGGNRVALAEACEVACDTTSPALWGAWGGAMGGTGTFAGNGNAGTLTYSVGGFAAGLDRRFWPNLLAGVTVGYQNGGQWTGGFDGRSTTNTVQAGLYASLNEGPVYLDGIAGYAYSANQMWRSMTIPGLQPRTAQGQTGANQFYGQVESGYRFDIGGTASAFVTPFARLQGSTATQNAFTESGAQSLNLNVVTQTTSSLRTVLGAQLGGAMDVGWREKLAAQFRLGWSHEFADTTRPVSASFAGASTVPFTVYGASPQRDGVVLGFSANTAIGDAASVYLRYEADISGQDSSHALTAGVRMTW